MTFLQENFKSMTVDHVLVGQKDELLHIINHADCMTLRGACMTLSILKDFWVSQSYGYKVNEVCDRISTEVERRDSQLPEKAERRDIRDIKKMVEAIRVPYELHTL